MPTWLRTIPAATAVLLLAVALACPASTALAQAPPRGWTSDRTFQIRFVGRDSSLGPDRYRVEFGYGGTFFGIAVTSMPLLPAEKSLALVLEGYRSAFPGRPQEHVQPDDSFDVLVPLGTFVTNQWRKTAQTIEYLSLRGDSLLIYTSPRGLIQYRLVRVEDPTHAEVVLNHDTDLRPYELAKAIYGKDDPNFKPDVLQVARARTAIMENQPSVTIDATRGHIDDFPEIRGIAERGGTSESGLSIYRFRAGQIAQPLFRVDDAIGETTDPAALPSLMRVYYYKNGTVRTYQRASETVMLSGRQPRGDEWASVFKQYGKLDPPPDRWEIGQPEQTDEAMELRQLGVAVLRYEPKEAFKGNFLTQFFDFLIALMTGKKRS